MRCMIAAVQFTATADLQRNFEACSRLIEKAFSMGAKMVFLPEAFDYISSSKEEGLSLAQKLDGPLISQYCQLARRKKLWLSLGGFHEKHDHIPDKLSNTHILINEAGDIISTYRKMHLFDVDIKGGVTQRESDRALAGPSITPPVQTPCGRLGLAVCYDMRFPEMSLALARQGATVLAYPSAFTVPTGADHWEVLLRARAIETQCYVVAAAQTGKHNASRESFGHAMIIDPWGAVIAQCSRGEGVCVAEVDQEYVDRVREQMPVQQHRRAELYNLG